MWDCSECGCKSIAPDLIFCPMCYTNRAELAELAEASAERSVPPAPQALDDGWGSGDAKD